jgi:hypothetical protein
MPLDLFGLVIFQVWPQVFCLVGVFALVDQDRDLLLLPSM